MKIFLPLSFSFFLLIFSCGESTHSDGSDTLPNGQLTRDQLVDSISKEEAKMRASKVYVPQQAMTALRLYTEFFTRFPNDTLTPEYLFLASNIAQGLGNYQQAAEFLETIIEKHPGFRKYPDAVFSAALLYDDHLEKVNFGADRAIQLYDYVIQKYPNTSYAESAKTLKEFVGKPDSVYDNYIMEQMKKNDSPK